MPQRLPLNRASPIPGYYDRLTRWNRLARPFRSRGSSPPCVHRHLADPLAGGRPTGSRLHDVILESIRCAPDPRVLDAGCGQGATMIHFAARLGGRYVGLTLSDTQAAIAREAAARLGLADRIDVRVHTYDDPPRGPFDLIVAIESLAHSADPARSTGALIDVLAPGGTLVVVDDMPEPGAEDSRDLATFQAGWHCPVLWRANDYRTRFAAAGLTVGERDLTADYTPRTSGRLAVLTWLNRWSHRLVPSASWRAVMDSHEGGLALERLYREGRMRYRLMAGSRG